MHCYLAPFGSGSFPSSPSRLQEFTQHISQLEKEDSFAKAAELLATLQADESIYRKELAELEQEIEELHKHEPLVVTTLRDKRQVQQQLEFAKEESQGIVDRSDKYPVLQVGRSTTSKSMGWLPSPGKS